MERVPGKDGAEQVRHPEIAELAEPMALIMERLRGRIENGDYGAVIGDDASGRIPALIMSRVLKRIHEERGFPPPETRFVAGSGSGPTRIEGQQYDEKVRALGEFVSDLGGGKRVLIVTEAVVTGRSLEPLMAALSGKGIAFDIAAIGFDETWGPETRGEVRQRFGAEIVAGGEDIFPKVLKRPDLSGVMKERSEMHADPAKEHAVRGPLLREWRKRRFQKKLNETRDDVNAVAEILLEDFRRQSTEVAA